MARQRRREHWLPFAHLMALTANVHKGKHGAPKHPRDFVPRELEDPETIRTLPKGQDLI